MFKHDYMNNFESTISKDELKAFLEGKIKVMFDNEIKLEIQKLDGFETKFSDYDLFTIECSKYNEQL